MTDHEEIRYLLRAILGELRVANEIAILRMASNPPLCRADQGDLNDEVASIRREYNTP